MFDNLCPFGTTRAVIISRCCSCVYLLFIYSYIYIYWGGGGGGRGGGGLFVSYCFFVWGGGGGFGHSNPFELWCRKLNWLASAVKVNYSDLELGTSSGVSMKTTGVTCFIFLEVFSVIPPPGDGFCQFHANFCSVVIPPEPQCLTPLLGAGDFIVFCWNLILITVTMVEGSRPITQLQSSRPHTDLCRIPEHASLGPRLVCKEPGLRPTGQSPCLPDKSSRS